MVLFTFVSKGWGGLVGGKARPDSLNGTRRDGATFAHLKKIFQELPNLPAQLVDPGGKARPPR